VHLQVLGELVDALGEDGDLDLRRTGVPLVRLVLLASMTAVFSALVIMVMTSFLCFRIRWRRTGRKGTAAKRQAPDPGTWTVLQYHTPRYL